MNRVVTSIRINEEVLKEAKVRAIQTDISLGQFIENAILHELKRTMK
jgi:predicted HicB family RNase H-like nuclease